MSAKHTPGPWCISKESPRIIKRDYSMIGSDGGELIASAHGYPNSGFFTSEEEAISNARLIAAAPELLEALRTAIVMLAEWHEELPDHVGDHEPAALASARAAIAKATGAGT